MGDTAGFVYAMILATVESEYAMILATARFVYATSLATVESEYAMTRVTVDFMSAMKAGTDQCASDRSRLILCVGHDGDTQH